MAAATGAGEGMPDELYSRQVYVVGAKGQGRLRAAKALLVGLDGVGVEVGACLLAGLVNAGRHRGWLLPQLKICASWELESCMSWMSKMCHMTTLAAK